MSACFEEKDMPGSYHDADCVSLAAQKLYLRIFRAMLITSVAAAFFTWLASTAPNERALLNSISLVLAVTALVSTFVLKERKFEDTWYLGRAVAESIKSRAWLYMTCAEPYAAGVDNDRADEMLIEDIRSILKDNSSLTLTRAAGKSRDEISKAMRDIRCSTLSERMAVYLECRIVDQRDWYGNKSNAHAGSESRLFVAVLICQFLASVIAFYGIIERSTVGDTGAVLAAAGAAFIAWLQVKKYQETAKAYSVASHELGLAAALAKAVITDEQASKFVKEAESAISREHTLWLARRSA